MKRKLDCFSRQRSGYLLLAKTNTEPSSSQKPRPSTVLWLTGWLWALLLLGVVLAGPLVIWRLDLAGTIFRGLPTCCVCAFCQWKPSLGFFPVALPCGLSISQNDSWLWEGVFQACECLGSGSASLHCILLMVVIHRASSDEGAREKTPCLRGSSGRTCAAIFNPA